MYKLYELYDQFVRANRICPVNSHFPTIRSKIKVWKRWIRNNEINSGDFQWALQGPICIWPDQIDQKSVKKLRKGLFDSKNVQGASLLKKCPTVEKIRFSETFKEVENFSNGVEDAENDPNFSKDIEDFQIGKKSMFKNNNLKFLKSFPR